MAKELVEELVEESIEWFKNKIGLFMKELDIRRELNESPCVHGRV
jgi:hypothetical protein